MTQTTIEEPRTQGVTVEKPMLVILKEIENDEGERTTAPWPYVKTSLHEAKLVDMLKEAGGAVMRPATAKAREVAARKLGVTVDKLPAAFPTLHVIPDRIDDAVSQLVSEGEIHLVESLGGLAFDRGTSETLAMGRIPDGLEVEEIRVLVYTGYFAKAGFEWLKPPAQQINDPQTGEWRDATLAELGFGKWPDANLLRSRGVDPRLVEEIVTPTGPSKATLETISKAFAGALQSAQAEAGGAEAARMNVEAMRTFERSIVGGLTWLATTLSCVPPFVPETEDLAPPAPFAQTVACLLNLARAFQAEASKLPWSSAQAQGPESF